MTLHPKDYERRGARLSSGAYWLLTTSPSLHPLVRDRRLDLDGDGADVLLAGGAHRVLDDLGELLRFALRALDDDLVVHDVDDHGVRPLQTVVQESERALDDVRRGTL